MLAVLLLIKLLLFVSCAILLPVQVIHCWSTQKYYKQTSSTKIMLNNQTQKKRHIATTLQMSSSTDNAIEIVHQPDSSFLSSKGVMDWPTWGCPVSKFPWSYSDTEICYLTRGKVIITPIIKNDHGPPPTPVTIAAGDYVTLPAGLSCTWDVIEAVEKHYMFD